MSDIIYYKNGEETFRISPSTPGTKCPETKLEIKMTEQKFTLELTLDELHMLDKYVEYCEETKEFFDKLKNAYPKQKSPAEEAYKFWWGEYPGNENWTSDATRWQGFQAGYNAAYEEKVSETVQEPEENEWKNVALKFGKKLPVILPYNYDELSPNAWYRWVVFTYDKYMEQRDIECGYTPNQKEQKWDAVRESVKWCEEHPDTDPLDWLKPQTPEQTSQSLKEAFREAQQTEKWKELQRKIDEEDNDKNFKNSLDLIKEWGEKNKPPTLKELLWEWWEDIFTVDSDLDADASIDVLVDRIDKEFIPPNSNSNDYQWNKCLELMRNKLR